MRARHCPESFNHYLAHPAFPDHSRRILDWFRDGCHSSRERHYPDSANESTKSRNMIKDVETVHMPVNLPFPQSPDYHCGKYGSWTLKEKLGDSFECGYFTGFDDEPPGHFLVSAQNHVWMSTSRLERESHAIHMKYAKGNVVVCGVGMGMYLFNIASLPRVNQIVAVDLDANVIDLVRHATAFESWQGGEKIRFVNKNALQLTSADIGMGQVDYLYVDIWPELGMAEAVTQTQKIQSIVKARKVGWWGQEIDFIDWLFTRRPKEHLPAVADFIDFARVTGLPIEEHSDEYVFGCRQAAQLFSAYRASLRQD
jgi:hypothetical protein